MTDPQNATIILSLVISTIAITFVGIIIILVRLPSKEKVKHDAARLRR